MSNLKEVVQGLIKQKLIKAAGGGAAYRTANIVQTNDDGTVTALLDGTGVTAKPMFPVIAGQQVVLVFDSSGGVSAVPTTPNSKLVNFDHGEFLTGGGQLRLAMTEDSNGFVVPQFAPFPCVRFQDAGTMKLYRLQEPSISGVISRNATNRVAFSPNGEYVAFAIIAFPFSGNKEFKARSYRLGSRLKAKKDANGNDIVYDPVNNVYQADATLIQDIPILFSDPDTFSTLYLEDVAVTNNGDIYHLMSGILSSNFSCPNQNINVGFPVLTTNTDHVFLQVYPIPPFGSFVGTISSPSSDSGFAVVTGIQQPRQEDISNGGTDPGQPGGIFIDVSCNTSTPVGCYVAVITATTTTISGSGTGPVGQIGMTISPYDRLWFFFYKNGVKQYTFSASDETSSPGNPATNLSSYSSRFVSGGGTNGILNALKGHVYFQKFDNIGNAGTFLQTDIFDMTTLSVIFSGPSNAVQVFSTGMTPQACNCTDGKNIISETSDGKHITLWTIQNMANPVSPTEIVFFGSPTGSGHWLDSNNTFAILLQVFKLTATPSQILAKQTTISGTPEPKISPKASIPTQWLLIPSDNGTTWMCFAQ